MTGHPPGVPAVVPAMNRTAPWSLAGLLALAPGACAAGEPAVRLIVQNSPLAGFQFHAGRALWSGLAVGDRLVLVREPDNAHDRYAVRVEWQGQLIGYVPRRENAHIAAQLDRGTGVQARIVKLVEHRNPRLRLAFEIYVDL